MRSPTLLRQKSVFASSPCAISDLKRKSGALHWAKIFPRNIPQSFYSHMPCERSSVDLKGPFSPTHHRWPNWLTYQELPERVVHFLPESRRRIVIARGVVFNKEQIARRAGRCGCQAIADLGVAGKRLDNRRRACHGRASHRHLARRGVKNASVEREP